MDAYIYSKLNHIRAKVMFQEIFIKKILTYKDSDKISFCINDNSYTYRNFFSIVSDIQSLISGVNDTIIGLYATDDIRTYASILALWFLGKAYVPLNPSQPIERHKDVISLTKIRYILSSDANYQLEHTNIIATSEITTSNNQECLPIKTILSDDKNLAYILFTSGSTGEPKGVQITRGNVAAFIDSMDNIGLNITEKDRCLQPFDLTFDFSVSSYVIPLVKGASIYTIPLKATKFTYIAQLLEDHRLTVLQMVPSMIRNLLPYLDEVDLRSVRYNILCGEALTGKVIKAWHRANEEMVSYNMYGPTEDTVFCSYYLVDQDNISDPLSNNDIISIGKTFKNNSVILVDDEQGQINMPEKVGELCLSGEQLTPGYWRNPKENEAKFFVLNNQRYYCTGDLCFFDKSGNLMFVSRKDFQVKINGFRVELEEIENQFFRISGGRFSVVIPFTNDQGNTELAMIIEGKEYDISNHKSDLVNVLPSYEVPNRFLFIKAIPLNQNGKIDRKQIKEKFNLK